MMISIIWKIEKSARPETQYPLILRKFLNVLSALILQRTIATVILARTESMRRQRGLLPVMCVIRRPVQLPITVQVPNVKRVRAWNRGCFPVLTVLYPVVLRALEIIF